MIPQLKDKTGSTLIGNLSSSMECLVTEERNGLFELTMVYPINYDVYASLTKGNIIVADANDTLKAQQFRIYMTRKMMSNRIEVYARHISFDLAYDFIEGLTITNQSCQYALSQIFSKSQFSTGYIGLSDIVNASSMTLSRVNCLEAIGGKQGSVLDTFGTGAEILRNNKTLSVLNARGHNNSVSIEYKKNLTGFELEEDDSDLVTRIYPYAIYTDTNNNEITVTVPAKFVDSPIINNYAHHYIKQYDYSDKFEDGVIPTASALIALANKEYTINKVDIPKQNFKIQFIPLSKCVGYEGLEDKISLCDTVTIIDTRYGVNTLAKVIKCVYDVLRDRYDSMELGKPRTTLGDVIGGTGDGQDGKPGPPGPPGPQGPPGADGSIGDFPNSLPNVPVLTSQVYGFGSVDLSWTYESQVYYEYELYASKTNNFTPNTFDLIFKGQASTFLHQVVPGETWYYRVCCVNSHGYRTAFSSQITVVTQKVTDLSNYVNSMAIGDALIGTLSLDRGWVGTLKGNWIDAKQLSVTDGNGKRTLDIDSFGNVNLDVANLKINASNVATQTYANTVGTNATNSANASTDGKLTNYSTTTQMNSAIQQKADSITNTVSQTYVNNGDYSADNNWRNQTYSTKSEMQQTANDITFKFRQTGNNIITNGRPKIGLDYWYAAYGSGTSSISLYNGSENNNGEFYKSGIWWNGNYNNDSYCVLENKTFQDYKFALYKTYSISLLIYSAHSNKNMSIFICDGNGTNAVVSHNTILNSTYNLITISFTPTFSGNIPVLQLYNYSNGAFSFYIPWIVIREGEPTNTWIPNPNEIQEGLTKVNKDGIEVSHNQDSSVSSFGADGARFFYNGREGIHINSGRMRFTSYSNGVREEVGTIQETYMSADNNQNGVSVLTTGNVGDYVGFGYMNTSGAITHSLLCTPRAYQGNSSIPYYGQAGIYALQSIYAKKGLVVSDNGGTNRFIVNNVITDGSQDHIKSSGNHNFGGFVFHTVNIRNYTLQNTLSNPLSRSVAFTSPIESEGNTVRFVYKDMEIKDGTCTISIPYRYMYNMQRYTVTSIVKKAKGDVWISEEYEDYFILNGDFDMLINVEVEIVLFNKEINA